MKDSDKNLLDADQMRVDAPEVKGRRWIPSREGVEFAVFEDDQSLTTEKQYFYKELTCRFHEYPSRKQGKTAYLIHAWNKFGVTIGSYPNKHEENAMRNLGCRGKMGYKESFYDRWPTKKSKVGSMFFFLGFLIKDLIHVYRRACASSDNSNYFAR